MKAFTFPQALLRWVIVVAIAWLFMFLTPGQWFVNWYLPMSFFLLMGVVTFGVIGLGWPLGAPGGSWNPSKSRWLTGVGMMVIWIVVALILTAIETWVWPKISPLTHASGVPTGVFFGIGVFMVTLWYAFDGIETRPFGPQRSWANWALASVIILVLASVLWAIFVNYNVPPTQAEPYNPNGVMFGGDWFALCVWIIVFIQMFGAPMVFQGWPFYKLGKVGWPVALTIFVVVAGYITWKWIMPNLFPDSTTFTWAAIGASMIGWSLMHSVAFEMYPFARLKQPMRGVGNFIVGQVLVVIVWILLCRYVLGPPIVSHLNGAFPAPAAGAAPPADINLVTAWLTLHVTAVVLLVHNFFFLRVPWPLPAPPLGPEEVPGAAPMAAPPAPSGAVLAD